VIPVNTGDKVLLRHSNNGMAKYDGQILEVLQITRSSDQSFSVKASDGATFTIYQSGPADDFCLADRKSRATYIAQEIRRLTEQLESLKEEVRELEEFNSDEEALSHKLFHISRADSPKAIEKILKELKKTHYL